jgi:hypothetical protein
MYEADWFFYMDDDIEYRRGEIFPELMTFTSDGSKVLFGVQDYAFLIMGRFRNRIHAYKSDYPGTNYYGSGFLLMRSVDVLRQELRNTIAYFGKHSESIRTSGCT